LIACYNLDK